MTPSARRRASALSPEQRRETIVRAALPLIAERGAAVTTAEVARAAGIAEGTIFRVFPDKNALLDAVVVEVLRPDHVLAELASIDLDQSLSTRLTEAGEALAAHLARMGAVLGTLHATGRPLDRRPPSPSTPAGAAPADPAATPTNPTAAAPGAGANVQAGPGAEAGAASGTGGGGALGTSAAPGAGAGPSAGGAGVRAGGGAQPAQYFERADSARAAAARRAPTEGPSLGRDESQLATMAALTDLFEPERAHLRVSPEQAAGIFLSLLFARGRQARPAADLETTVDVFLYGALDVPAPS